MFLPTNITLKFGDSGDFVAELQRRLSAVNCFNSDAINGFYDGGTVNAVSSFQSRSGINADGIAGPETLRRLNGVISGDNSSSTDNKAAEEERLRQEAIALQLRQQQEMLAEQQRQQEAQLLQQQQQAAAQQWQQPQPQAPAVQHEVSYAPQPAYVPPAPVMQPLAPQAMDPIALANQQQAAENAQPRNIAAVPPRPPEPVQVQPVNLHQQPPAMAPAPAPVQVLTPQPQQQAPVVAVAAAPPRPVAIEAVPPQPQQAAANVVAPQEAAPAPKGIVGRVTQYANEMVQKIASYIESKLPNHVLNEVKEIGLTMAKSGVKEVAIPAGPEQQRGADTPVRGPQQQQAQIRS